MSRAALLLAVLSLAACGGGGGKPAWKDKLRDADIETVIAWFQSLWPEDIYRQWRAMEEKTRS